MLRKGACYLLTVSVCMKLRTSDNDEQSDCEEFERLWEARQEFC